MNLRRLQASARLVSFQTQRKVDPAPGRGLNPGECSARGDERNIGLAGLNGDLSQSCGGVDERFENRAEHRQTERSFQPGNSTKRIFSSLQYQESNTLAWRGSVTPPGIDRRYPII